METKSRILTKAQQLFAKQGIRAITMDHIAGQLGVSKRTIYIHFKNKNDLLNNCIKAKMVSQKTKDDRIISNAPNCLVALIKFMEYNISVVKSINPKYYSDLEKYYPGIWDSKIKEIKDYRNKRLVDLLKNGVDKNVFRRDIDVEIVAITIHNLYKSICTPFVYPKQKHSEKLVFPNAIVNYTRGIVTELGLKYFESDHLKNLNHA